MTPARAGVYTEATPAWYPATYLSSEADNPA